MVLHNEINIVIQNTSNNSVNNNLLTVIVSVFIMACVNTNKIIIIAYIFVSLHILFIILLIKLLSPF
jgi:succinate-acetate transporter protein